MHLLTYRRLDFQKKKKTKYYVFIFFVEQLLSDFWSVLISHRRENYLNSNLFVSIQRFDVVIKRSFFFLLLLKKLSKEAVIEWESRTRSQRCVVRRRIVFQRLLNFRFPETLWFFSTTLSLSLCLSQEARENLLNSFEAVKFFTLPIFQDFCNYGQIYIMGVTRRVF